MKYRCAAQIASKGLIPIPDADRPDEARANAGGGYGLGLSITSEIARRHGAPLKASSSGELGTSFTLTIQSVDGGE